MSVPCALSERWPASLSARFTALQDETRLVDRRHYGPLRIQRPFYPEASKRVCHVYLLHPPGGLVSGDEIDVAIRVDPGAWGLVTTPGANKVYRSDGRRPVTLTQRLDIAAGGVLEWLPQENIVFDGAEAALTTRVELAESARFIGSEVTALGRPASGERMEHCTLGVNLEIWRQGQALWLERARFRDHGALFGAAWGLNDWPVAASLVCTHHDADLLARLRREISTDSNALFAVTELPVGIVCRFLGAQVEQAHACLRRAWHILRPAALGTSAVTPRIWNT